VASRAAFVVPAERLRMRRAYNRPQAGRVRLLQKNAPQSGLAGRNRNALCQHAKEVIPFLHVRRGFDTLGTVWRRVLAWASLALGSAGCRTRTARTYPVRDQLTTIGIALPPGGRPLDRLCSVCRFPFSPSFRAKSIPPARRASSPRGEHSLSVLSECIFAVLRRIDLRCERGHALVRRHPDQSWFFFCTPQENSACPSCLL
jgi:hypothetical protein